MSIMDLKVNNPPDLSEPYKEFVRQMSDWYDGGELPERAGQDLRFTLELQRQKLHSLGLDMKCELKKNNGKIDVGGLSIGDRIFINTIVGGNMDLTRSIDCNHDQIYESTEDIGLSAIIQSLKTDTQPSAGMALSCPHCGAPSTLGELEGGCKFCGTKFLMNELFPKVMNFFIYGKNDREKDRAKNKRDFARIFAVCCVPMLIIGVIANLFIDQTPSKILNIIYGITGGIFAGAYIAFMIFVFKKLFEVFSLMGKHSRGGAHTMSTLFYASKIKKYDPEFSSEYFRDKIMSLFKMAVYSKGAEELACCRCQCPDKAADIIEAQLFNFNINGCSIKDRVCDAEVTLFLDCLHYTNGKIESKTDKFRMSLRKHIKNPTELGFSFAAVSCPSCGGSFDARHVKACPYCNTEYLHEEHDWVVTDIW